MAEIDALRDAQPVKGGGLFLSEFPARIRVLTTNPIVSKDNYGNTRYAYVVWCLDDNKPHVINKGPSVHNQFLAIHQDPDYGSDIRKIDLKIVVSGKGKETRYTVNPLPETKELTNEQIKQAAEVNLDNVIKNGIRLSEFNQGEKVPSSDTEPEDTVYEVTGDEDINPDGIPF